MVMGTIQEQTDDPAAKTLIVSLLTQPWRKGIWKIHDAEPLSVFLSRGTSGNASV